MTNTLRSLILLAVTAVMVAPAQSAPVTYTFTGSKIYEYGYNPSGNTISGTVTLDVDAAPDSATDDGDRKEGVWLNGAFAVNAITNTGYTTGTAQGGGTTTYDKIDLDNRPLNEDAIYWDFTDSFIDSHIGLYSFSYQDRDGDFYDKVANPWALMTAEYNAIHIREYNYITGEYYHAYYVIDSFSSDPPPDTVAPTFTSLTPSVATLSPPNHQMVPITLAAVTSDNVGVVSTKIISATSSEPDNGLGDGDTANDIQITGDLALSLRAERSGKGNGRTYTITVETADAAGNKTQMRTTVSVPKSQSAKK